MPEVLVLNRQRRHAVPLDRLRRFALGLAGRARAEAADFSVLLTTDRTIRRYNCRFRGKDESTDVLSFPGRDSLPDGVDKPYLGDMMISVETAYRQALTRNHSLEREICTLMIHGWLHLLGFDHELDQGQMRRKELRLQRELL